MTTDALIQRIRLANWPILLKVMAAPLATLGFLALLSVHGWQTLKTQRAVLTAGYEEFAPVLAHAYEIPQSLARIDAHLYRLSVWSQIGVKGAELERTLKSIHEALRQADGGIQMLEAAGVAGTDRLRDAFNAYRDNTSQVMLLILRNATLGAVAARGGDTIFSRVESLAQEAAANASQHFRQKANRASRDARELARKFIWQSLLAGSLAVVASYLASRAIIRPIRELVQTINRLLHGKLKGEVPYTERSDEIGSISLSVRELQRVLIENRRLEEEREEKRVKLEYLALHDGLTGLANRKALDLLLEEVIRAPHREKDNLICLLIDLDSFKPINDTYGHEAGDAVLKELARRFSLLARPGDMVARIGGDEFGIAITSDDRPLDAASIATRFLDATRDPIDHDGKVLRVGASIGAVRLNDIDGDGEALMAAADQAMYAAKQDKRPSFSVFTRNTTPERVGVHDREELEEALRSGAFVPYYQPKIDLRSKTHAGFEALARWHHPTRGVLTPEDFLPRISRFGLQGDFTGAITTQVLADLDGFLKQGLAPGGVAINIEEATLASHSGLDDLCRLIESMPHLAPLITLEITEDVFIARAAEMIRQNVETLAAMGVRISMDDFGTGYGSFQHLRQFTFHEMKIDTEFVAGIGKDRSSEVIIEGFLSIANGLGADVVAEGIETEAQERYMRQRGCHFGQGYRFGAPMPRATAEIYLRDDKATRQASS
ncbi:putative bifunctional diguanylate cyclase/phosphodiesterase [Stappia indica]|uniref:putative bifunctional diguanylate cyclase/phosphodiesterase n=1 Tax=Stappia indica TaxID=538381 RepID=UPI001CD537FC|nr:bifunctional diguanylate cyclase/phosphodiesterase [Stappia indica]MCA1297142.1 EAL domain-containing protein [Stappia indica]